MSAYAVGDMFYANTPDTQTLLHIGSEGQIMQVASGIPSWQTASSPVSTLVSSVVAVASAITLSSNSPSNVTSISLAAGTWDVSCMCMFTATALLSGGSSRASISLTSATEGTNGLNRNVLPLVAVLSTSDLGITIPQYRITVATTTNVYLVAASVFTLGTCKAYGNLTAIKV